MTHPLRGFGHEDLPEDVGAAELAGSLRLGRELDAYATGEHGAPNVDFVDRVMAAVEAEPVPRPAVAAGRAVMRARPLAVLAAVRDAWRVAFSGGRPMVIRAQALGLVLVAVLALGAVGGAATVGALALLDRPQPTPSPTLPAPSPSIEATPSVAPSASPSPSVPASPTPSASPTSTPDETETPEPTGTDDADEPTETPEGSDDDNSGPGGDDDSPEPDDNSGPGGGGSDD